MQRKERVWVHLSQLSDLFRQASNFRIGDTARVLVRHVVDQRVNFSGEVPGGGKGDDKLLLSHYAFHVLRKSHLKSMLDLFIYKCEQKTMLNSMKCKYALLKRNHFIFKHWR